MSDLPNHSIAQARAWLNAVRTTVRWAAGFSISLLVAWAITAVATESTYSKIWNDSLGQNVPIPGTSYNNREEAWATTQFGELGLVGINVLHPTPTSKIIIWGDSFVASFEVDDKDKMHTHLQHLLDEVTPGKYQALINGRRGQSFADYIFQVPAYEKAITPISLHVIHLFTLEDMYPDLENRFSLFLSKPEFHFVRYDNEFREIEEPIEYSPTKDLAYRLRLQFFIRMKKRGGANRKAGRDEILARTSINKGEQF